MTMFIQPTPQTGFSRDSVDWWDFHPKTEESEALKLPFPMIEIGFSGGGQKRLYGEAAEIVFEFLSESALPLFIPPTKPIEHIGGEASTAGDEVDLAYGQFE